MIAYDSLRHKPGQQYNPVYPNTFATKPNPGRHSPCVYIYDTEVLAVVQHIMIMQQIPMFDSVLCINRYIR